MLQVPTAVQNTFVVRLQGDDMVFLLLVEVCDAFDCKVVCLSSTRCKYDFLWICPNQGGNL